MTMQRINLNCMTMQRINLNSMTMQRINLNCVTMQYHNISLSGFIYITVNPFSEMRVLGESVTFCCEAKGLPSAITYKW